MTLRSDISFGRLTKVDRVDKSRPPRAGIEVITDVPEYYDLLELDRPATQQDITEAYRYFAKKYHPVNHKHEDQATRERFRSLFKACNEAYEILGSHESRAVYDFYGGKAVRNGILHKQFDFREGAAYQKDIKDKPKEYFRKFTYRKGILPKISSETEKLSTYLEELDRDLNYTDPEPEISELHLTLEELYNGGVKTVIRKVAVLDEYKRSVTTVDEAVELRITPGFTHGTRIIHKGAGTQDICTHAPDLIFQVVADLHPQFCLDGYNLHVTVTIPLADIMGVGPIFLTHLDGRKIFISLTELACPNVDKVIAGEGLPKDTYRTEFGDLYVSFDIVFPDEIDPYQKLELWVALVDYPRVRAPLHYAIAPISETSLRSAQKMNLDHPFASATNLEKKQELSIR